MVKQDQDIELQCLLWPLNVFLSLLTLLYSMSLHSHCHRVGTETKHQYLP